MNRLLYVAATRAKNALIICERVVKRKKPIWESLLEGAIQTFSIEENKTGQKSTDAVSEIVKAEKLYREADCCVLNNRNSQNATYEVKTPSHLSAPSKLTENYAETLESKEGEVKDNLPNKKAYSKTAHKFPDLLGTMTHRLMETIVSYKDRVDSDKAVDEIIREYRTEETENYEGDLKAALMDVARTMKTGGYAQSNGAPQNLLEILKGASEVYCEVPFCYIDLDNGKDEHKELWNGVIDLIYCKEGKWHSVDYKTNVNGDDLDKKYIAQLEAYKKAFKANTGDGADALTYHIDI